MSFTHGATIGVHGRSGMLLVGGLISFAFNRIKHEDLASGNHPGNAPAPAAH